MRTILPLVAALSAILTSGCISAKQQVRYPDQTRSIEDPSKGRIYLVRPAAGGKGEIKISVADVKTGRRYMAIGDVDSGGLRGQHLCWETAPGKIRIIADTIRGGVVKNGCSTDLTVQAGMTYYVVQGMSLGGKYPMPTLEQVSEEKGRKEVGGTGQPKVSQGR